jgi:UDP-glucuronate 4-epimerase
MAIHLFARKIRAGEEVPFYGDGTTRRDYTYVDDTVQGVLGALAIDEEFGVYNLGESRTVELRELIAILEKELGKTAKLKRMAEQPGDVRQTFADIGKARKTLGYKPVVPIEEGIKRFVAWMKR